MKIIRTNLVRGTVLAFLSGATLSPAAWANATAAAERAQTRQLNLQAAGQSVVPTAAPVPAMPTGGQPDLAPMALNSLASPPDKIATARVVDDKGVVVGAVQKVELDSLGKPTQVTIALLGSEKLIALDSAQLSYDKSDNIVTAALDKSQLAQLPAAPQG